MAVNTHHTLRQLATKNWFGRHSLFSRPACQFTLVFAQRMSSISSSYFIKRLRRLERSTMRPRKRDARRL